MLSGYAYIYPLPRLLTLPISRVSEIDTSLIHTIKLYLGWYIAFFLSHPPTCHFNAIHAIHAIMSTPTSRSNPSLYSTFAQNGSAYRYEKSYSISSCRSLTPIFQPDCLPRRYLIHKYSPHKIHPFYQVTLSFSNTFQWLRF